MGFPWHRCRTVHLALLNFMRLARACFSSLSRSLWNITLYFIMMCITKWHHWSLKWFSPMSFGDQYNAKQLYYRVHLDFIAENNVIVTHPLLPKSQHIPHAGDMIQLLCSLTGLLNHIMIYFQNSNICFISICLLRTVSESVNVLMTLNLNWYVF